MEATKEAKHFVLVHGACHGAWCWYKLKPLLEASGHRVTAIDLAASGINPKLIQEIRSFSAYSEPLIDVMSSLSPGEKVILVGHSLGGMNLAVVMDKFPDKVSVGVFLNGLMPDSVNKPSYVLEELVKRVPTENWMNSKFEACGDPEDPSISVLLSFDFMKHKLYQLCSIQDLTLAMTLLRPSSFFTQDLAKLNAFSSEGYGKVKRVYIVCNEDIGLTVEFQRWMIENSPPGDVKEIDGADHMPMLSKPQELCDCLLEIADEIK